MAPLIGDPLYRELKTYLIDVTGLGYYRGRDGDLIRILKNRFEAAEVNSVAQYLALIRGRDRKPAELDALISELTIGETYFFRHAEQMEILEREVLPEIIARKAPSRTLGVWTAGCSNGAETYSIAMLLRNRFGAALQGWSIRLLGTDIDADAITQARGAKYNAWALRATPAGIRKTCFQPEGDLWSVRPEYMRDVQWEQANLIGELPAHWWSQFDLVICRNVFIYLSPQAAQTAAANLVGSLDPHGWLMLGHADCLPFSGADGELEMVDALGLYKRRKAGKQVAPQAFPALDLEPQLRSACGGPATALPSQSDPRENRTTVPVHVAALANAGPEADSQFQSILKLRAMDPSVHFYYGLFLAHQGRASESEQSLRRALYLNPGMVLAHFHLGLALESRKEIQEASRCYRNVLDLLDAEDDAALCAPEDGLSTGELKAMAQSRLEACR